MPEQYETSRRSTRRQETGRLTPRAFSKRAWHRFDRDRRRRYLAELSGPPTNEQSTRIESLIRCEWFALKAEAEGTLRGDREAREHRRLLDRLLGDFERSLAKPMIDYHQHVARRNRVVA